MKFFGDRKMKRVLYIFRFSLITLIYLGVTCVLGAYSPDERNIPYVPYVVVEKTKNDFDFDHAQETIVKYLENRSHRQSYEEDIGQSTTLYDYFKTSSPRPLAPAFESKHINLHPEKYHLSLRHLESVNPTTIRFHQTYRYATTPTSFNVSSINKSYDTLATNPPPVMDLAVQETKYHSLKDAHFIPFKEMPNINLDAPIFKYPLEDAEIMKCSLRSSRYVYDGECRSKKPIVETVCADRCIKYEYNKPNNHPLYGGIPNMNKYHKSLEVKRQVVALACRDGDINKQKIKLYCKDGTIINNIIRTVNNCVCQEHSEKVHTTKKNAKIKPSLKRIYHRPTPQRLQIRPRF